VFGYPSDQTDFMTIHRATLSDIPALVAIEDGAFSGDRLNSKRFKHFIRSDHSELWCLGDTVKAYALVLYHRGTSLARLYSIAVDPAHRGQGLAKQLLAWAEDHAVQRGVFFMRLEVRQDNQGALQLYQQQGYRIIKALDDYYEDHASGWRLEKHLSSGRKLPEGLPFYAQSTPFTCGPATLMMALNSVRADYPISRLEELTIWREATTIYLTTGHGGCSPQGLALAAVKRGMQVRLLLSDLSVPFIDGVRSEHKREVMTLVNNAFNDECAANGVEQVVSPLSIELLAEALAQGDKVLLLISTYRLNRNKAPHWVWLVGMDDAFAYINDPDVDHDLDQAATDNVFVPVSHENLAAMIQYGRRRYTAAVILTE
jgi:ribosomal protein S18 acetylase RimI-like enzyme